MTGTGMEVQLNPKTYTESEAELHRVFYIQYPIQFSRKLVQIFINSDSKVNVI